MDEIKKVINRKNEEGFTLIEIMVALFLITIILALVATSSFSSRQKLDEALETFERGFRFSADEAVLRNSLVRVRVLLEKEPAEVVVEFGPDDSFVLPAPVDGSIVLSRDEEEAQKKLREDINKKFNRVREFQEKNVVLPEEVRVVGAGTTSNFVESGEFSFYTYPSGERNKEIVILATDEEVAILKIEPFLQEFEREYIPLGNTKGIDLIERQNELGKEYYERWRK